MPYLIAGNAGGAFRTGRYLTFNSASSNDLLSAIVNGYGIATNTFGNPNYATAPLPGVLA
jgi:hypothetical protein